MSYDTAEISNYDAIPISLYEFSLGSTTWRYASGDEDVVLNGNTYTAIAVEDEGVSQAGATSGDDFIIELSAEADFHTLFIGTPPSEPIFVLMRRMNRGETEAPVQWAGTMKSSKRVSHTMREIRCRTLTSSLNRNGLRLSWGRNCSYALYDRQCGVDANAFAVATSVTSKQGRDVWLDGISGLGDGYLDGGFIRFISVSGAVERLAIEQHSGNKVTLLGVPDRLSVADMVTVNPGCDRITSTCKNKFNNLSNYGGIPHLPTKSPFDGDPVF